MLKKKSTDTAEANFLFHLLSFIPRGNCCPEVMCIVPVSYFDHIFIYI